MDAFQTLADQTRRQIVETLRGGEQQVNDIVNVLDIHQSGVSRHLRLLLQTGFVRVRPEGQHRYYSLRPERFRELEAWVASYRKLWDARLTRFGEALERRQSMNAAKKVSRQTPAQKGAPHAAHGQPREGRPGSTVSGRTPAQKEKKHDE
jgi:DNA-binding transcriptional ArsR family regulator